MNKEIIERLSKTAIEFQVLSEKTRNETREKYKSLETNGIFSIRVVLDGQIARLALSFKNKIEKPNQQISYQLYLSASFIRTHFIINDLIISGDIIEAATLARKQLENVTRLVEIDEKPLDKLLRKTPNVFDTLKKMGKSIYKELSEIAHFGTPRVGELIKTESSEDDKNGPTPLPLYTTKLNEIYKIHCAISIYFVFWIINFLKGVYKDSYDSESDEMTIFDIFQVAKREGIIVDLKDEK